MTTDLKKQNAYKFITELVNKILFETALIMRLKYNLIVATRDGKLKVFVSFCSLSTHECQGQAR